MNATTPTRRTMTVSHLYAAGSGPVLAGRAARVQAIELFNNSIFLEVVIALTPNDGRVDGLVFRATNAVARGVAAKTGLNVYHLGGDTFVAANG